MANSILRDYVAEAQFILKNYPIEPMIVKQHQYNNKKAVWFIKTKDHSYALKRYTLTKEKWEKIISAYYYLYQKEINIGSLIVSNNYKPWIAHNNNYYILTSWVKGSLPDFTNPQDITKLTKNIANLHQQSKEYTPSTRDYKDKCSEIQRKQGLLLEYKYEAENTSKESFSRIYLKNFKHFFDIWEDGTNNYCNSTYEKCMKKLKEKPCLCLNSFSPQNFSLDKDGNLWTLHLDKICIDFPTTDLRQLLFKIMYINEDWNEEIFSKIIKNYMKVNNLTKDELKLLLTDLEMPHLFFNISSHYYLFPNNTAYKAKLTTNLTNAIELESKKTKLLQKFWELV